MMTCCCACILASMLYISAIGSLVVVSLDVRVIHGGRQADCGAQPAGARCSTSELESAISEETALDIDWTLTSTKLRIAWDCTGDCVLGFELGGVPPARDLVCVCVCVCG